MDNLDQFHANLAEVRAQGTYVRPVDPVTQKLVEHENNGKSIYDALATTKHPRSYGGTKLDGTALGI